MNFKNLTSVVAAGVVAASMVITPSATIAAGFTPEYVDAHEWATTNGIIKKTSIEQAEMTTSTTKAMMAKMLVNFAEKYGFVDANSKIAQAADCKDFADIDYLKNQDLHEYVIRACEYGIMWRDSASNGVAKNFAPQQKVSRAIFATALDRVLSKDLNNGKGNDWYTAHLNALNKLWIMKDTNNAGRDVIKGDVLLMLHRSVTNLAEKMKETSECTKLEQVVCMLGGECSEACSKIVDVKTTDDEDSNTTTDDKVKSGKLVVTNEENDSLVITDGYESELDTINFKADEEITVNSISLERIGLTKADVEVWLENEEGQKVTSEKTVNSKDAVVLNFKKDYRTVKGTKAYTIIVKTPEGSKVTDLGTNIGFNVTAIDSTAKDVSNKATAGNKYAFADYTAQGITVKDQGSDKQYDYEEGKMYEVAKMKITSKDVAVNVAGFTLEQLSGADLDDINEVEVLMDGVAIKNVKSSIKKDDLVISFPEQEIAIKSNAIFTVNVSLSSFEDFGTSYKFKADSSDFIITEVKNNVRVKTTDSVTFSTYTFNGNQIEFENEKLSSTINIAQDGEGIIAKGSIKVNGQPVKTSETTVTISSDTLTGGQIKKSIESIELLVNGVSETEISNARLTVNGDDTVTGSFKSVTIDDNSTIELKVTLSTEAELDSKLTIKLGTNESLINGTSLGLSYEDAKSAELNTLGSISISDIKIQQAKTSLTNDTTKKVEFKTSTTSEKTIFEGTYTAKKQDVNLNGVIITRTDSETINFTTGNSMELTVYVNGKAVDSVNVKNLKDGVYTGSFADVKVKAEDTAVVKVVAKGYAKDATTHNIEFFIKMLGEDENNNPTASTSVDCAPIAFVEANAVTVTTNAAMKLNDVILSNKNQTIAQLIVKPSNKATSANISSVEIASNLAKVNGNPDVENSYYIYINGHDYADEFEFNTAGTGMKTSDLDIDITGETEIKVVYKGEPTTDVDGVVVSVNGKDSSVFTRKVVPAIVRIVAQESVNDKSQTRFTFDVEFADNVENQKVENVKLNGKAEMSWSTISDGDTKTVPNGPTSEKIVSITYANPDGGADIEITNDSTTWYPEFFEINGDAIMVFSDK